MAYIEANPLMEFELEKWYARQKLAGTGATERDVFPYLTRRRPAWKMWAQSVGKPYVDWLYDKKHGQGRSQVLKRSWDKKKGQKKKRRGKVFGALGEAGGEALGGALRGAAGEFLPETEDVAWYAQMGAVGVVGLILVGGGFLYYVTRPAK